MQINQNEIHIWRTHLNISPHEEEKAFLLLSADEIERANRFHFPIHRTRFIAGRSVLRYLLSQYLALPSKEISFAYTEFGKPYLSFSYHEHLDLQFNLSHAEDQVIYAFSLAYPVGIDIEKIRSDCPLTVAERYFHPQEIKYLQQLSIQDQEQIFYRIWSRKEAIIKAMGEGLSTPLSSFAVSLKDEEEIIIINHQSWSLLPLTFPDYYLNYETALATNQTLDTIKIIYQNSENIQNML